MEQKKNKFYFYYKIVKLDKMNIKVNLLIL